MTTSTKTPLVTNSVRFFAIACTALPLMPAGAHLLELPNKLGLPADEYLIVQQLYRGWALAGVIVAAALISTGVLVYKLRGQSGWVAAVVAMACILATQLVFWSTTYPVNIATENWSFLPTDWKTLRLRWEFSHAASALLNLAALFAASIAALRSNLPTRYEPHAVL